jgi:hypothetical protein
MICCDFYKKREKGIFKISGLILMAVMFEFNVILASFIISDYYPEMLAGASIFKSRYYIVISSLLFFMAVLFVKYFRFSSYDDVVQKFNLMSGGQQRKYYWFAVSYLLASFISTIGYAVHMGMR